MNENTINMFSNKFTEYLTNNGWLRVDPMTFESQENTNVKIFFDNSNQIEIYNLKKRVATYYIVEIEELIRILNKLSDFP